MGEVEPGRQLSAQDAPSVAAPDSDEALLLRIAHQRDVEAFAQLLRRHSGGAYRLAQKLSTCPDLAEEAVQEAFLRIWQAAGQYRRGGNPRGWILSIVVREALKQARGRRRRRNRDLRSEATREHHAPASVEPGSEERLELSGALRQALAQLAPAQRELVALYFGGEMSQQQIGEVLSISQRLVGYRLKCAVADLRRRLAGMGVATGVAVEGDGWLRAAFEALSEPSAGPTRGLEDRILQARATSPDARKGLANSQGLQLGVFTAALVALAVGLAWARGQGGKEQEGRDAASGLGQARTGTAGILGEAGSVAAGGRADGEAPMAYREWTFKEGPASDLEVLRGSFTWTGRQGERAGWMAGLASSDTVVRLPIGFSRQPFVVELEIPRAIAEGSWMADAWAYGGERGAERHLISSSWRQKSVNFSPLAKRQTQCYFFDHRDATLLSPLPVEKRVRFTRDYLREGVLKGVVVIFENVYLERIVVRPLNAAELEQVRLGSERVRAMREPFFAEKGVGGTICWRTDTFIRP